jgi:hypothetical protein
VTLTNTGGSALTIKSLSSGSKDYSQTNNCPISPKVLAAGSSCVITVSFTPSVAGLRVGSITITDNTVDNPQTISLTGFGVAK